MNNPLKRTSSTSFVPSHDERDPTRRKLTKSLEYVQDDFGSATHKYLDEEVLKHLKPQPFTPPLATLIIGFVVWTAGARLNQEYSNSIAAMHLMEEYPDLVDKVKVAWENRSFEQIRNLSATNVCLPSVC